MSTHEGGAQSYENAPPTQPYGDGFSAGMRGPPQAFSRDDEMDRLIKANCDDDEKGLLQTILEIRRKKKKDMES